MAGRFPSYSRQSLLEEESNDRDRIDGLKFAVFVQPPTDFMFWNMWLQIYWRIELQIHVNWISWFCNFDASMLHSVKHLNLLLSWNFRPT